MLKKDSFIIGSLAAVIIFFVLYSIVNLFTDFSQSRDSLWVYIVSIIPNILLARFMLVNWNIEKTGRGMMFVSLLGVLLVMYFVLK